MAQSSVAPMVGRMPFSGIQTVRPAALRGALAARRGDMETLAACDRRIAEMAGLNRLFAGIGAAVMALNTYSAIKNGSVVHGAEATLGGLIATGFTTAAYAQYCIRGQLQGLATRCEVRAVDEPLQENESLPLPPEAETEAAAQPQEYPDFRTPPPRFSGVIDNIAAYGSVIGLAHPAFDILQQFSQQQ